MKNPRKRNSIKIKLLTLLSLLLIPAIFLRGNESAFHSYSIAIVPQTSAASIEKKWTPLLHYIKEKTGIELALEHYKTIPLFEEGLARGTPDIAYMNPYHALRAYELSGYTPIIRDKTKLLYGQLWVHSDSEVKELADLNGRKIVFPAPNAFGASLYMRALLNTSEGIAFEASYVKTHSNVYRHVALGRAAAGGGVARTYQLESDTLKDQLRLIYQTPGVRPHPICTHPRVDSEARELIARAILEYHDLSDESRANLKTLGIPQPVRSDFETDYLVLKDLKLSAFAEGAMK